MTSKGKPAIKASEASVPSQVFRSSSKQVDKAQLEMFKEAINETNDAAKRAK